MSYYRGTLQGSSRTLRHGCLRYTRAMDTRILDALRNAPSVDLYELNLALNRMLGDPKRILEVRRHLSLGA